VLIFPVIRIVPLSNLREEVCSFFISYIVILASKPVFRLNAKHNNIWDLMDFHVFFRKKILILPLEYSKRGIGQAKHTKLSGKLLRCDLFEMASFFQIW
jgi:hypothetical protein